MSRFVDVNINDHIVFELNESGRKIWKDREDKLCNEHPMLCREIVYPDKLQLWDFMATFGPYMYLGGDCPFKTDVKIEVK